MLNIALRVRHPLRKCNPGTVQSRERFPVLLGHEPARCVIKHRRDSLALDPQLGQCFRPVPNGLAHVLAVRKLSRVRLRLVRVRGRDGRQVLADRRRGEHGGLEVCARPDGDFALEAGVVAQDPPVALLGVAEGMAGEPPDVELGVCGGGEIGEVAEDKDGRVRGADYGNLSGCVGGDGGGEFCGGERGVKVDGV